MKELITEYNDIGEILTSREYVRGELDGVSKMWHKSTVILYSEYAKGQRDGKTICYSLEGIKVIEKNYRKGKLHGKYQSWWDNGKIKEIGYYLDGKKVGEYIWYTTTGEFWKKCNFNTDSKVTAVP